MPRKNKPTPNPAPPPKKLPGTPQPRSDIKDVEAALAAATRPAQSVKMHGLTPAMFARVRKALGKCEHDEVVDLIVELRNVPTFDVTLG